jgi:hypothetical protein
VCNESKFSRSLFVYKTIAGDAQIAPTIFSSSFRNLFKVSINSGESLKVLAPASPPGRTIASN